MKQFFLFLLSISVSNVFSQIQTENITSQKLGDTRKVTVVLPENYNKKEQYPLLLVLDANRLLEPTVSSVRYFSRLGEVRQVFPGVRSARLRESRRGRLRCRTRVRRRGAPLDEAGASPWSRGGQQWWGGREQESRRSAVAGRERPG